MRARPKWKKISTHLSCARCGALTPRRGPQQKYCLPCSEAASVDRQNRWRKSSVQTHRQRESRERIIANGIETSKELRRSIGDVAPDIALLWSVRVCLPFSPSASKNYIYGLSVAGGGHVYRRQTSRRYRADLTAALRRALRGQQVFHNKLWIDIFVEKENHKSDAVNVVDLVCDAVKEAVDLDDRWFSIRFLDWSINKHEPRLFVGIGQDAQEDVQVCSYCGRLLPLDQFHKNSRSRLGVSRECRECVRGRKK